MAPAGKYRYTGTHAQEIMVGDKTVMTEPGGFVNLKDEDLKNPYNKSLIDAGFLIEADKGGDK